MADFSRIVRYSVAVTTVVLILTGCLFKSDSVKEPLPQIPNPFFQEVFLNSQEVPSELRSLMRIKFFPDGKNLFLLFIEGGICQYSFDNGQSELVGCFTFPGIGIMEVGLSDVLFDPDFENNGYLYFALSTNDNQWNQIIRVSWYGNVDQIIASVDTVLNISRMDPPQPWHGMSSFAFGDDGNIYVAVGDAVIDNTAQDNTNLLGKLLQVKPDPLTGFKNASDVSILASGLRSPFRMVLVPNGIYFGDVGTSYYEEINYYSMGSTLNFGWPECEGPCAAEFENPVLSIARNLATDSIASIRSDTFNIIHEFDFLHEDPLVDSIYFRGIHSPASLILGVYYENNVPDPYLGQLKNRLIYTDFFKGYIRGAVVAQNGDLEDDMHIAHGDSITSMDIGPDGKIYSSINTGRVLVLNYSAP